MTGRYVRSTFVEGRREFVEHLQIGKQIGKVLDMPKRPQAQKHIFLGLEYEKSGNLVPNFEKFEKIIKMLTQTMCRMAMTLFQTSS